MRKLPLLILPVLLSQPAYGSNVLELSAFTKSSDEVIRRCYEGVMTAKQKGRALCNPQGVDEYWDYWVCPAGKDVRVKALEGCRSEAKSAQDQAAMLYLLGLLHQDFRYQSDPWGCPELYRHQEGSGVCVYTDDHFNELIQRFPESSYADMGAFQRAEEAYRYYECEGQKMCAVQNQITGWIDFLRVFPKSPLAGQATEKIVAAFDSLAGAKFDLPWEDPERLLEDIENLNAIAVNLSAENREKLKRSLARARPIVTKVKEDQAKM